VHVHGLRPDHERGLPCTRVGQQVLHGAADRHHVGERGLHPQLPQLSHVVLAGAARIIGDKGEALAGSANLGDGLDRPRRGPIPEIDAAIEIEDQLVVRRNKGGEGHGPIVRVSLKQR
jgi:hypothetical protein